MSRWSESTRGEAGAEPAEKFDQPETASFRGRGLGLLLAGIWLVYLIDPFLQMWQRRSEPGAGLGAAAVGVFAALYLLTFLVSRSRFGNPEIRLFRNAPGWLSLVGYASLAACAGIAAIAGGQAGTGTWIFLAVAGLFVFPMRPALGLGGVIAVALLLLPYWVPGWAPDTSMAVAAVLAMVALSASILALRRQRQVASMRVENARLQAEEERGRVARDLHDILGHSLTVISVKADLASRVIDADPARARQELGDIQRLSREALADVRHTLAEMRTLSLPQELSKARAALVAAGVEPHLPAAVDEVAGDRRDAFAWAVREAVTNVVRHARARHCWVEVSADRVTITDDGVGASAGVAGSSVDGNGLRGLRERAARIGAVVIVETVEPDGFSLTMATREAAGGSGGAPPSAEVSKERGSDD